MERRGRRTEANEERVRQLGEQVKLTGDYADGYMNLALGSINETSSELAVIAIRFYRTLAMLESELASALKGRRTGETR